MKRKIGGRESNLDAVLRLDAREFISGKTRTAFQDKLLSELRSECWQQGVEIRAALVRDIQPPAEIASLIRV